MNDPNANRAGYKQTKAGWIPQDWSCARLGELGRFLKGTGITKSHLTPQGVPAVRYGDIYTTHDITVRNFVSFVSEETSLQATPLHCGDIIFASSGETAEEIGKCTAILSSIKCVAGGDTIILRAPSANSHWLAAFLSSSGPRRELMRVAQGQSVVHVYESNLKELFVALPSELEQNKVAEILSASDDAIERVGDLIRVKKRQKKALLQQLLAGKKRLPGFQQRVGTTSTRIGVLPSDWEVIPFSDAFDRVGKSIKLDPNGTYREIGIRSHGRGIFHKAEVAGRDLGDKRVFSVEVGCLTFNIVFAWEQAVAVTSEAERGFIASHRFPMYRARKNWNVDFVATYLKTLRGKHILGIASPGGAGRNRTLGQSELRFISIPHPPLAEQNMIMEVILAANRETDLLEAKWETLKRQKNALMQKLLTGQIRVKV